MASARTFTILPLLTVSDDAVLITVPDSASSVSTRTFSGIVSRNPQGHLLHVTDAETQSTSLIISYHSRVKDSPHLVVLYYPNDDKHPPLIMDLEIVYAELARYSKSLENYKKYTCKQKASSSKPEDDTLPIREVTPSPETSASFVHVGKLQRKDDQIVFSTSNPKNTFSCSAIKYGCFYYKLSHQFIQKNVGYGRYDNLEYRHVKDNIFRITKNNVTVQLELKPSYAIPQY